MNDSGLDLESGQKKKKFPKKLIIGTNDKSRVWNIFFIIAW